MAWLTTKMIIYLAYKVKIDLLLVKKVNVLFEYPNFTIIFLKKSVQILL